MIYNFFEIDISASDLPTIFLICSTFSCFVYRFLCCFLNLVIRIRYPMILFWTIKLQKNLQNSFLCDIIALRHNLIFGQTMGEVFFISVKTHSLFWLSLVVCQKLCRNNRSYVFFGALTSVGALFYFWRKKMIKRFISLLVVTGVICCLPACKSIENNTSTAVTAEEAAIGFLQGCVTYDYDKIDQYGVLNHKTNTLIWVDYYLDSGVCVYDEKTYIFNSQADVFAFWAETGGYEQIFKTYEEFKTEETKYSKQRAKEFLGEYKIDFKVHNVTDMTPNEISSFIEEQEDNWKMKETSMQLEDIIDFSQVEEYKTVYLDTFFNSEKYGYQELMSDEWELQDGLPVVKIDNHWKVVNLYSYCPMNLYPPM